MRLSEKACAPIEEGTPPLTSGDIEKYIQELVGGWRIIDNIKIMKTFTFQNFLEAVEFVNKIAEIAEAGDHHPDLRVHSYKKVDVELTTHSVGGLSENDFILAAKIEGVG